MLDPSAIEFTEKRGRFPYLLDHGPIREQARAGYLAGLATGEPASVDVTLSNEGNRCARLLRQPIRAPAVLYGDDNELLFSGLIAGLTYGITISITLDA